MSESLSLGFALLVDVDPGARALEVSADGGERARALLARGAKVTCLRQRDEEVERLRAQGIDAERLEPGEPAADAPRFDLALLALAFGRTRGREWPTRDPERLLRAVLDRLAPGAALVLAVPNPLLGWPVVGAAATRLARRDAASVAGRPHGRPGCVLLSERRLKRLLTAVGLVDVHVFASLPDAERPKFLVPLGERAVTRYFFTYLAPRPHSAFRRAALAIASRLPLPFFERLVPAYQAAARKRESS